MKLTYQPFNCRSDLMVLTDIFTYADSAHDFFEREPYCAKFHIFDAGKPFVFVAFHSIF